MMQCWKFQRQRRPKLFDVRASLIEMHENAGTCAYSVSTSNAAVVLLLDRIGHLTSVTI